jgi:hypothetical protein
MPALSLLVQQQVDRLVDLGYPALAGIEPDALRAHGERLAEAVREVPLPDPAEPGDPAVAAGVPAVVVVSDRLLPVEPVVPTLHLQGRTEPGVLDRNHGEPGLAPYRPIDAVDVPPVPLYLLLGVQRGDEFRGQTPEQALPAILARGRTPLTIPEGVALLIQAPQLLASGHGFSLAGSRRGDRRVPALWVSGRAPKLGWCWDGNPHDWLGVASAAARLA